MEVELFILMLLVALVMKSTFSLVLIHILHTIALTLLMLESFAGVMVLLKLDI